MKENGHNPEDVREVQIARELIKIAMGNHADWRGRVVSLAKELLSIYTKQS